MAKSAADLRKRADELRQQYQKIVHEAKVQERLEEQKRREAAEREENAFNKSFVEFAKTLPANKTGTTAYDYIIAKMNSQSISSDGAEARTAIPAAGAYQQNSAQQQ